MPNPVGQRTRPGWKFGFLWVLATGAGALLGPALAFPVNLALVALVGVTAPVPGTLIDQALILTADGLAATMLFIGLGMGFCQWLLLRRYVEHSAVWIPATGAAMLLAGLFRLSLPPDTPVELIGPLTIPAGAVSLALCQWFALRGRVANAWRWAVICIAGWVPTLAFSVAAECTGFPDESPLALVIILIGTALPFAAAAGGMAWLLGGTARSSQAMA